jgi:TonB family protein
MFLDFDEDRPETPRVAPALTRLERVLLVIVGYQLLMLGYFLVPDSWVQPVKQMIVPDEPVRFVRIAPVVESPAPKKAAQPQPSPMNDAPAANNAAPSNPVVSPQPVAAPPTPQPTPAPVLGDPEPPAPTIPGGILGSARKNLDRFAQSSPSRSPNSGIDEQGPAIQFDSRGVDFGPWLRRFRAQVIRNWFIPQTAEVMRGHVVITMRVERDGRLTNIRVVRSSGIDPFDRAAMTALRLSTPTLQLPEEYPLQAIDPFTVIFYYNEPIR